MSSRKLRARKDHTCTWAFGNTLHCLTLHLSYACRFPSSFTPSPASVMQRVCHHAARLNSCSVFEIMQRVWQHAARLTSCSMQRVWHSFCPVHVQRLYIPMLRRPNIPFMPTQSTPFFLVHGNGNFTFLSVLVVICDSALSPRTYT